ncbi:AraC family transcriptional regulator [Cellulomonas triticagri]|uniref:AraC family transcriptional regulator n=1 Tax=Cellulomonas triticagri TaxID=2483352 RepID=A0A3M2J6M2_9CELL|nr:helix-turn-helix domain-containing protein [Cellulomonas triticagri]RMI09772.1 AraC family transcriptional regulator [Cellulomonas triticagri]
MAALTSARTSVAIPPRSPGLVEALWVARSPHGAPPRVALPDGRPAAVVRLAGHVRWVDPFSREEERIGSVLRGPRSTPQVVLADGDAPVWEIGVRLAPWALSALHPADALVDAHRPLGDALGLDADAWTALERRLRAAGDDAAAAVRALEDVLEAAVRRPVPAHERADLDRVVAVADAERGLVRPLDLARAVDRSLASLHALFAAHLGMTPGAFLSAVRLSCAVRELGVDDRGDAAGVVRVLRSYADAGYAPREVERFTGMSALDLRRSLRGMEELLATA